MTHVMRWLGAATRCHDVAVDYVSRREGFGGTLGDLGMIGSMKAYAPYQLDPARKHQTVAAEIVSDLEDRLVNLFRLGPNGRPGDQREYPNGPLWDEHVTFSEYFHGDTGVGLGAAHQTGWTALVAHYICSDHAPHLPGVLPGE